MLYTMPKTISSVSYEIVTITPDIARAWLDQNVSNRRVNQTYVDSFARDMRNGSWRLTGDAVRFDTGRNLIDGQHRLLACIKANAPFSTCVIYGLPPETKEAIDIGRPRTSADVMAMKGIANSSTIQSTIRALLQIKHGALSAVALNSRWTISEMMNLLDYHKELPASVRTCLGVRGPSIPSTAALYYVAAHLLEQQERADAMVAVLTKGVPDFPNDPMHRLRERMLRGRTERSVRIPHPERLGLLIHAWNNFVKRRPLHILKLPDDVRIVGLETDLI